MATAHPYDFLVQHGRLARAQVKSCFTTQQGYDRHRYPVVVARHTRKRTVAYSSDEIDFIAAFIAPQHAWYVIRVESLKKRKFINLYPRGKRKRVGAFYETYREAWHLLKEPELAETGENKQQVAPGSGEVPYP